ncbi:MAG TPA: hypothetical protein VGB14_01665 [Acidimicrobiales bacterium]|jgi:hypothetical protein
MPGAGFLERACTVDGCFRPVNARGLCSKHYQRWRRYGDPLYERPKRCCAVAGCLEPHYSLGYCRSHHRRFVEYGDPLKGFAVESPTVTCVCIEPDPSPSWSFAPGGFGPNECRRCRLLVVTDAVLAGVERHRARVAAGRAARAA